MNFEAWVADLAAGTATHESGFVLQVEGDPRDPSAINPANFPANLSFVDQARLMRCGLEFLAKAAASNPGYTSYTGASRGATDIESLKSEATREREALARQFAERADKPVRATLSLKKK